jgi:hypothetical protein
MSRKAKAVGTLFLTIGLVLGLATAALANIARIYIDCDSVDVKFSLFPATGVNSATVIINGSAHSVTWTGSDHTASFSIAPQDGDTVTVQASWTTSSGETGSTSSSKTIEGCTPSPSPSPSPTPTHSPSPSPTPTEIPSPSPTPSESPSPSPTPSESPSPSPTSTAISPPPTTGTSPPPPAEVVVKPATTKPESGGQAEGGAGGGAAQLAFTGPTGALRAIGAFALLMFMTGVALLWIGRYRGVHRGS